MSLDVPRRGTGEGRDKGDVQEGRREWRREPDQEIRSRPFNVPVHYLTRVGANPAILFVGVCNYMHR